MTGTFDFEVFCYVQPYLIILLRKVWTLLEWTDGLLSKILDGLDGWWSVHPLLRLKTLVTISNNIYATNILVAIITTLDSLRQMQKGRSRSKQRRCDERPCVLVASTRAPGLQTEQFGLEGEDLKLLSILSMFSRTYNNDLLGRNTSKNLCRSRTAKCSDKHAT